MNMLGLLTLVFSTYTVSCFLDHFAVAFMSRSLLADVVKINHIFMKIYRPALRNSLIFNRV